MDLVADGLLIAGALAAAFYCWVLSVRVKALTNLDDGLGGAIASLSEKVDEMRAALDAARAAADASIEDLETLSARAEKAQADLKSAEEARPARRYMPEEFEPEPAPETRARPEPDLSEENAEALSAAERLQEQIREKLHKRSDQDGQDDIVKTLQNLLAASK